MAPSRSRRITPRIFPTSRRDHNHERHPSTSLCALEGCIVDLADARPNKRYCSDSCKQGAGYARSDRHKVAQEHHQEHLERLEALSPAARERTLKATRNRSFRRQLRRIKTQLPELRQEREERAARLQAGLQGGGPLANFKVPTAEDVATRQEEILERSGWSDLAGFVQAALGSLGVQHVRAYSTGKGPRVHQ
jgi:hypothetical protein